MPGRITEFTEIVTIADDDLFEVVDISETDPTLKNKKVPTSKIRTAIGNATETVAGLVELATNAEAITGSDTTRAVHPAGLNAALSAYVAAQDVEVFKGFIDCSANPNYPAASAGHVYRVSVAGKIGGGSGPNVEVNDRLECFVDGTAAGTHAAVGANWMISQVNIDGAVVGPASATDNGFARFDGTTGKLIKNSAATISSATVDGTATNDSAAAGKIGEFIESSIASGAAVSLVSDIAKTITSYLFPAGDWDAAAISYFNLGGSTTITYADCYISLANDGADPTAGKWGRNSFPSGTVLSQLTSVKAGPCRISLASPTLVYMVSQAGFGVSTCAVWGQIRARRIR